MTEVILKTSHVAIRISFTAARELITGLRGARQSIVKFSSNTAWATSLRASEKAKWLRSLTACRRFGAFSNLQV